ncbi:MAG TPA: alanine racemase [Leucothrix mucor]|nr:alanine racemase [Leucothrix mucor]
MRRSARITIHPKALVHNLQQAKLAAPNSKVLAVIKANAYGHGVVETAKALQQETDAYAVSCIPEAQTLRESGIQHPILVLQGHQNQSDLLVASKLELRLVIHSEEQLVFLDQLGANSVKLALKLDTGMHRLGINPADTSSIYRRLKNHSNIDPDIWLMTHLSCADDLDNNYTNTQLTTFSHHAKQISAPTSIANSAGILGWTATHGNWIRPGIMLYGSSPFSRQENNRDKYNLQAAMTLSAPLIAIHNLKKGNPIGYGASYHCPHDMQVGIVACGYADGYPRHATTGTPASLNKVETHIVGRVSMDMIAISLHNIYAQVGDIVELWGANISIDRVAFHAETISYELLCNAGNNCARH